MPLSEAFTVTRLPSPIGVMLVITDSAGVLRALDWEDHAARMHALLRRQYGPGLALARGRGAGGAAPGAGGLFRRRARGARRAPGGDGRHAIPAPGLGGAAADPSRARPRAMARWPSASAGRPAVRAVGAANGANPVSLVLPCHRVIGADDTLTGYGGGLERKRWLLAHEGALPESERRRQAA